MILYLDTETTGLYPGQVCQLSYIMQTKEETTAKNFFFTVDYVEYGAQQVHGLSVEKLKKLSNGLRFRDCIDEIKCDFERADLIIAHNFNFDYMFLSTEFNRQLLDLPIKQSFCSMKSMTPICKILKSNGKSFKYPKLNEMCKFYEISDSQIEKCAVKLFGDTGEFHDARFDTTSVYLSINEGFKCNVFKDLEKFL